MLSIPHLIVVFVIALVVFGPQKLPELARTLGKLMAEFRKASGDFKSAFEEEMRDLERQAAAAERRKIAEAAAASAAAATPAEPATLATPPGVETLTEASDPPPDRRATKAPVITPVAESVARSTEPESPDSTEVASQPVESVSEHEPTAASQDTHDAQHPA
jgi:sec-independent protein translocase protein TatB